MKETKIELPVEAFRASRFSIDPEKLTALLFGVPSSAVKKRPQELEDLSDCILSLDSSQKFKCQEQDSNI